MPSNANVYWSSTIVTAASVADEQIIVCELAQVAASDFASNLKVIATFTFTPDADATVLEVQFGYGAPDNIVDFGDLYAPPIASVLPTTLTFMAVTQLPPGTHSVYLKVLFASAIAPSSIDAATLIGFVGD